MQPDDEEKQLRSVALQNMQSILLARQRAEQELIKTKEALEEETRILELLNQTGAALASTLDSQSLLQTVTIAGTRLSGAQLGAFFRSPGAADPEALSPYTLSGAARDAFEHFELPRLRALILTAFDSHAVIRIADILEEPSRSQLESQDGVPPGHAPIRSFLAVPVVGRAGALVGRLFFGHAEPGVFTERAERLTVGISAQAAIAIDNARMYEEAKHAAEERARLLEAERSARKELERVSVLKDEFVATLSHELRTPLNAIIGWSDILLLRFRNDESAETRRALETIARNARAQARLVDDLLDINRMVSGKLRLDVQYTDLASILESALDSIQPSASAKGIMVRKTIDTGAGPVFGDPNRLQQIVWNLLTNAVKFSAKGGVIDVVLQHVGTHIEVIVRDTGMGISPEFQAHLFERFRQADASATRKYGGLGLGLSIVKQLVELHGGIIEARSEGEGKGATFTVRLPQGANRQTEAPAEPKAAPGSARVRSPQISLSGITVLVVDDEPDARDLLNAVLDDAGAMVLVAASAAEGLALLQQRSPDVIVSDIGMPECDGYQFMRDVRDLNAPENSTPAVALTAFARSEDRTRAMLAGYQVHVSKPIDPHELVATIMGLTSHGPRRS
jgi:signal transduction histidine kinase/ActR/RegA family two-component response regulator